MGEDLFPHVTASLAGHTVSAGQVAELLLRPPGLWPALVRAALGPLLEVAPLGGGAVTWYDAGKGVWPWGEGARSGRGLVPPPGVKAKEEEHDWYEVLEREVEGVPRLATALAPGAGTCPADSLRPGLKLELASSSAAGEVWGVTVTSNTGGMLGLSYDSPELAAPATHLRLWYSSPRLLPCGTVAASGGALRFVVPAALRAREYPEQVWRAVTQSFAEVAADRQAPPWCFAPRPPPPHGFEERMLLTVLDPDSRDVFRVAIVDRVVDQGAFLVSLLERPEARLLCRGDSEHIVPISWAIGQGLLDKASLQTMSCSPLSRIAPRALFLALALPAVPHRPGQAIELCTDPDSLEFRRAVVEEVKGRVVRVAVRGLGTRFTTSASLDNFPEGWCSSNGLVLVGEEEEEEEKDEEMTERQVEAVAALPPEVGSSWCPPIYFNHQCYSASFLSRHRLESLPR